MYVSDYGRYPYGMTLGNTMVDATHPGFAGWWYNRLEPYLAGTWTNAPWICPLNPNQPPNIVMNGPIISTESAQGSYGYNMSGTGDGTLTWQKKIALLRLGYMGVVGEQVPNSGVEGSVRVPSQMIEVGDAFYGSPQLSPRWVELVLTNFSAAQLARWHSHLTGANIVFCDSHVDFVKDRDLYSATETARRRWNNDNEPHPETW
jgi:prepilin-type processing-associated H-X9-DG protein